MIHLTDQSVDAKKIMGRYLNYTRQEGVQYESLVGPQQTPATETIASEKSQVAELKDFNTLMESR